MTPAELDKLCKETTRKFGLNKCLECSKALAKALEEKGVSGERVRLKAEGHTRGFVVMKNPKFRLPFSAGSDAAIADSGQHFGVRVHGKIFCNVFREGISAKDWEGQFDCDTHRLGLSVVEKF